MKFIQAYFLPAAASTILSVASFIFLMPAASAEDIKDHVNRLKTHYQDTLAIRAFSLNHHYTNKQYRDHNYWDYQAPNVYMSVRTVEVDLDKKYFYDNDLVYFSGGRLFDRVQFQNDEESFYYERSATSLGKAVVRRDMGNFDRFMSYMAMNIDFLAIRPLLEETDIEGTITLRQNTEAGTITFIHKTSEDSLIDYEFRNDTLQLVSINHRPLQGIFVYDDYHTTRGITYARYVRSYYDGATEPQYVKFNNHFSIIERVDPARLELPEGYGPELSRGDGVLVSKEIAKDLYLVTDSSAVVNSLLKVDGNSIMVFGATVTNAVAEKTIGFIHDQFPDKKISSVYVTHPHGHQISGLKAFADLGTEILADDYTIAGIKAYQPFAEDITNFKFRSIKHDQTIEGVDFYVLENMHSKRQSFAYFKDSGIIFQTHFLHVPRDNTIAKIIPNYTRTFIDFVRQKQLQVNRIVSNYRNNNISVDVMNKTYAVNF